jgi:tripartite-type tricarboxylate transporter receptor subunit TctC
MQPSMRLTRRLALASAGAVIVTMASGLAARAEYPERPLELIVPWGPGGGADQLARLIGKLAEPLLGQGLAVINVPGATGGTGMAKLLSAPADGYSLAIYIADSHALLAGKDPRWTMNEIAPVAIMLQGPSFIFVAQSSRFKTWQDLENEARAHPGKLKIATLGFGSVDDFSISAIERVKGIKFIQVPFSKPSERYVSILGGHADALYEQAGDVGSFIHNKQMRPLLIFGKERLPAFNEVPCSYELGTPVALPQFRSIIVRAGTPPDRIKKLSEVLAKVAVMPDYVKFLHDQYAAEGSFIDSANATQYLNEQLQDMQKAVAAH